MKLRQIGREKKGIALMVTLLIILFILILTGALIKTQSGSFALMRVSDRQRDARMAARGLYDFCLYQIEHNREWGRAGFGDVADVNPARGGEAALGDINSRFVIDSVLGNRFEGRLTDENLAFRVEVSNALTAAAATLNSDGVEARSEQVVLLIEIGERRAGSFDPIQKATAVLQLAPLFDASVLSREDLMIDANELFFSTKDRNRNEVRTEADVSLPGLRSGDTRFLDFHPDLLDEAVDSGSTSFDGNGLLYAGNDVKDDGEVLDQEGKQLAAAASGGRVVGNGAKRVDIYDLEPDNIPQPSAAELTHDIEVPPGEFRFDRITATITLQETVQTKEDQYTRITTRSQDIDVCAYYDPPGSALPKKIVRSDVDTNIPPTNPNATSVVLSVDVPTLPNVPVDIGARFYLDSSFGGSKTTPEGELIPEHGIRSEADGGSGPVVIDLHEHSVTVAPDTRVRPKSRPEGSQLPPSSFELTVEAGTRPTFNLGTEKNDVIFEADGDITVGSGITEGLGTLISRQGSVTLEPQPQPFTWEYRFNPDLGYNEWVLVEQGIDVAANDKYKGLVIYADKDVNVLNTGSADWTFRGFVYANGKFNFDVGNEKALFFGSVVSRGRGVAEGEAGFSIRNGNRLGFVYDPEYLKQLTRELPNNWTRVETVRWNSSEG